MTHNIDVVKCVVVVVDVGVLNDVGTDTHTHTDNSA